MSIIIGNNFFAIKFPILLPTKRLKIPTDGFMKQAAVASIRKIIDVGSAIDVRKESL